MKKKQAFLPGGGMVFVLLLFWSVLMIVESLSTIATTQTPPRQRDVLATYILVDDGDDSDGSTVAATCYEMGSLPCEADKEDEDEVELLFPTARGRFLFELHHPSTSSSSSSQEEKLVTIRRTSFGCGKLGYQIWPTSIAICLYFMSHQNQMMIQGKRVMELGAGCGLPSVVFRDVLGADAVLATDFWQLDEAFDTARLVPTKYHGMNLEYNVGTVQPLDWHDPESVRSAKSFGADLIVGCDLIYYPADVDSLWSTLQILMETNSDKAGASTPILLCSPLPPIVRDALPDFRLLLEQKAATGEYHVKMDEMTMYEGKVGKNGERFLRMLISKNYS